MVQTKEKIEAVFRAMGVLPTKREKRGNYDIFYGEGFSHPPHTRWVATGALNEGDFPHGCDVMLYWVGLGERLLLGEPMFFGVFKTTPKYRNDLAQKHALKAIKAFKKKLESVH